MTIDDAIEILEIYIPDPDAVEVVVSIDAIQLGIEALKRVKLLRTSAFYPHNKLLYGETEE